MARGDAPNLDAQGSEKIGVDGMVADFPWGGAGWQHLKEALFEAAGRVGRSDADQPPATSRKIRVSHTPYLSRPTTVPKLLPPRVRPQHKRRRPFRTTPSPLHYIVLFIT